jgi:hypothetical protein
MLIDKGIWMRLMMTRLFALAAAAAVAVPLTVTGCSSTQSSARPSAHAPATPKPKPEANCGTTGCAMVRTSRTVPSPTLLYGASCSGVHGSWFLNAVQGGGSDALRPSYALQWSFTRGATSARPSARLINVPSTKKATVTLSLTNGRMKLTGVRRPNTRVTATGTLIVRLSGPVSSPNLTFIERGLFAAEHKLGLSSPFDAGGHPLVLPIQHVKTLRGC